MVSSLTRNQVPGNRLRVRIPCPPLLIHKHLRRLAECGGRKRNRMLPTICPPQSAPCVTEAWEIGW